MDIFFFITLYAASPAALVSAALYAFTGKGGRSLFLRGTTLVWIGALALLLGGNILLGRLGLAWRNWPGGLLVALFVVGALLSGWTAAALFWDRRKRVGGVLLPSLLTLCVMMMSIGMYLVGFGGAVQYGGEERVLVHEGRLLVEVDRSFLDPMYYYYEYRGPIFRGSQEVYSKVGWDCPRLEDDRTA